jgi:hypothetical protein
MTLARGLRAARLGAALSLCAALALASSCSSRPPAEYIPPRLDLARYEALGIAEFGAERKSELGAFTTAEFVAAVHAAQPGTPVLELGPMGKRKATPEAIRELAAREHLSAIFVG